MKPLTTRIIWTIFLILAGQTGHAFADPIYFDFQSRIYPGPNTGQSNGSDGPYSVSFAPTTPAGQGSAELDPGSGTHIAGPGSINIANLLWQVQSIPPNMPGSDSTFNAQSFKLALTLTDQASHAQGTLDFQGNFSGTTASGGNLSFTPSIQPLVLGHNTYTVDLSHQTQWNTYQNTWMLEAANGGSYNIMAQVNVQPLPPHSAPEPASLSLAGLGLATILGDHLRRRRRQTPKLRIL